VGSTLSALLATLTGYALFMGPEAIPLFPQEFIRAAALSWFPAFLAIEVAALGGPFRWTGSLLAAISPVTLTAVFGLPAIWMAAGVAIGILVGAAVWLPSGMNRWIPASAPVVFTVLILLVGGDGLLAGMRTRTLGSARFHARQAQNLEAAGHLDDALHSRARVVELAPADPLAHYNLGVVLARLGKYTDAAEAFTESVSLDPDFAEGHENLGHVNMALGEWARARQVFLQAIGAWERRLQSGGLPAAGRRRAQQRILELGDLLATELSGPTHSR
jgi:hypothetical protein